MEYSTRLFFVILSLDLDQMKYKLSSLRSCKFVVELAFICSIGFFKDVELDDFVSTLELFRLTGGFGGDLYD
jgi:hypothetical protein